MNVVQVKVVQEKQNVFAAWKRDGGRMPIGAALPLNGQWTGQPRFLPKMAIEAKSPSKEQSNGRGAKPVSQFERQYLPSESRVMF